MSTFEHFGAAHGPRQVGVILGRTQPQSGRGNRRNHKMTPRPWQSSKAPPPAPPGSPGAGTDSGRAAHRGWAGETTDSGSAAPVSSQKACSTGTRSSAARLSGTTMISGRPAAFCSRTKSKAFAVGISPETRIRPVPSFRWEATREKAGNFSTSVKRSRTKGRTMPLDFNRAGGSVGASVPLVQRLARARTLAPTLKPAELRSAGRVRASAPTWFAARDGSGRWGRRRR